MSDWQPTATAPTDKIVIGWLVNGQQYMRKDFCGQWRSRTGRPLDTPTCWIDQPPTPPLDLRKRTPVRPPVAKTSKAHA